MRIRNAFAGVALVASALASACSPDNLSPSTVKSESSEFCRALKSDYDLRDLRSAIQRNDSKAIVESLRRFRDLQLKAPAAVADAMTDVVDAVEDTVRAVTAVGPDGADTTPVDPTALDSRLAEIGPSAQKLVSYADEKCGIKLQ